MPAASAADMLVLVLVLPVSATGTLGAARMAARAAAVPGAGRVRTCFTGLVRCCAGAVGMGGTTLPGGVAGRADVIRPGGDVGGADVVQAGGSAGAVGAVLAGGTARAGGATPPGHCTGT